MIKKQINQGNREGIRIALIVLTANSFLVVLKYWIGIELASVAIMAEAWHGLSDSITTIIVLIGFKMAARPPDHEHPFGHGRMEVISSLVIAIILSLVAFNFLADSTDRLMQGQSAQYNQTALLIFIISLVVKELMAQISIRTGTKIDSESLIADGWHHRSDALASMVIIVGIFLNPYFWWIDGAMGIIISLIIARIAFNILKNTTSTLLGEKPQADFVRQLERLVRKNGFGNVKLHHIHLHRYGKHRELTFHIVLPGDMKLEEARRITSQLEKTINTQMSVETTIHIDTE